MEASNVLVRGGGWRGGGRGRGVRRCRGRGVEVPTRFPFFELTPTGAGRYARRPGKLSLTAELQCETITR